ncbi:MAG: D-2-hydroxyacid dehydrogenase [Halieaceae bacterium]
MPEVLIVGDDSEYYGQLLDAMKLPEWHCRCLENPLIAGESFTNVEVLFGPPDLLLQILPQCASLKWVQSSWAGVTPLTRGTRRDFRLTGVKGIFGELMREYVLGWMLALERNIPARASARSWQPVIDGSLHGKSLGVMGTGSIGCSVAQAAKGFGLEVRGLNSDGRPVQGFDVCFDTASALEFAEGLDYLVALLPATNATTGLINESVFEALSPGAVFINAGRANCLVLDDLKAMLASGKLRAAVLDVLDREPLPESDPLWALENLYITSHTAAPTQASAVVAVFAENYRRFVAGDPLLYQVDFERGY